MKLLQRLKAALLKRKRVLLAVGSLGLLAFLTPVSGLAADVTKGISMSQISDNVTDAMKSLASIIHAVSILGGIAFFVAFAFKAKQHRDNPTQITIGQPLMYLFLAIVLAMLPWFISSSTQIVYGDDASVSQWDHAQMKELFGDSGTTSSSGKS